MKISKLLSVVCVFIFSASLIPLLAEDNAAQAAARAALMKHMNQTAAPQTAAPAPAAAAVVAPKPSAEAVTPAAPAPAKLSAADQERARVALLEKMGATSPQPVKTKAPAVAPAVPSPVLIVAPAPPIALTREQRLQSLLAKYKADQVTPEQYHTQRAAILAEP